MKSPIFKSLMLTGCLFLSLQAAATDCFKADGDMKTAILGLTESASLYIQGTPGQTVTQYMVKGEKTKISDDLSCNPGMPIDCLLPDGPVVFMLGYSKKGMTLIARGSHLALKPVEGHGPDLVLSVIPAKKDQRLTINAVDSKECKSIFSDEGGIQFPHRDHDRDPANK